MTIKVPKPEMTDYERARFATEVAFNELVKQAKAMGLQISPVMGLMYLPTQALTRQFQDACKAVLLALTPESSHVDGGWSHWEPDNPEAS